VCIQVLLHEATLRLMTGANPASHARFSLRCRRRVTSPVSASQQPAAAADDTCNDDYQIYDDDDDDDDDDDENVVYDYKTVQEGRNVKDN